MWTCPACNSVLIEDDRVFRCDNHHSYDVAKEGYVNLLLAHHKRSKEPGDNKAMINARRGFLEQNHYLPLAKLLSDLIIEYSQVEPIEIYDAGCGEGYYLHTISQLLTKHQTKMVAAGSDISKIAVQKAAKKYPHNHFSVASSFNLPVVENSRDVLVQIFAPVSDKQVHKVLKVKGIWLQVNPGAAHLTELKQAVYEQAQAHQTELSVPEGFVQLEQKTLSFSMTLKEDSVRENLLMMTPYYWSVEQGKLHKVLDAMGKLTAEFDVRVYQKIAT